MRTTAVQIAADILSGNSAPPVPDDSNIIYFPPPASAEEPPEPFVAPRGGKPPLDEDFIHARLQDLTEKYREIPENPSPWPMIVAIAGAWLIASAALAFVLIG